MYPEERQRIYEEELVRFQARKILEDKYEAKGMAIAVIVAVIFAVGICYLITALWPYFINSLVIPVVKH